MDTPSTSRPVPSSRTTASQTAESHGAEFGGVAGRGGNTGSLRRAISVPQMSNLDGVQVRGNTGAVNAATGSARRGVPLTSIMTGGKDASKQKMGRMSRVGGQALGRDDKGNAMIVMRAQEYNNMRASRLVVQMERNQTQAQIGVTAMRNSKAMASLSVSHADKGLIKYEATDLYKNIQGV